MIRRHILLGITAFAAMISTAMPGWGGPANFGGGNSSSIHAGAASRYDLLEADDLTAVHYSFDLTQEQVLDRAKQDAEALGMPLVRTLVAGNIAVYDASLEDVQARLQTTEDIPVVALSRICTPPGLRHPDRLFAFTSRALLNFQHGTSESEKESFYKVMGYTRIREAASGTVLVDTHQQPGMGMVSYLDRISDRSPILASVDCDVVMCAETAGIKDDSIKVDDPFAPYQWYMDNTPAKTYGLGTVDEDLDVPRAWMYNKRNIEQFTGNTEWVFGNPSVVVGVFDAGIETSHEDLVDSLDSRTGVDYVDDGAPTPSNNLLGAHGTAMAGVIAASRNDKGIVGIAPDTKIYAVRILGEDYTAALDSVYTGSSGTNFGAAASGSTSAIVLGLQDSIYRDLDVNLHSYTLGVSELGSDMVSSIDTALRQSFEAGRRGSGLGIFGTTNIAAAGNFFSQVEYPACSFWTFAVGSFTSLGSPSYQANWDGLGIDFSMPGFAPAGDSISNGTTLGVLSTDRAGVQGLASTGSTLEGNENGIYAGNGLVPVIGYPQYLSAGNADQDRRFERFFGGTSYSAAMAAGVVALLYSDIRYTYLPPLNIDLSADEPPVDKDYSDRTRADYRTRAPLAHDFRDPSARLASNILSVLQTFSDIPSKSVAGLFPETVSPIDPYRYLEDYNDPFRLLTQLSFIDQYNERVGFGRPNPARALAAGEGLPSPDTAYSSFFVPADPAEDPGALIYSVRWDSTSSAAQTDLTPGSDQYEALKQGWSSVEGEEIAISTEEDAEPIVISPFLVPVRTLYFEDHTDVAPDSEPGEAPMGIYVWEDSLTTAPENSDDEEISSNLLYNPRGAYAANRTISLQSPIIETAGTAAQRPSDGEPGTPMFVTLYLAHQLSVQNVSTLNVSAGSQPNPTWEPDTLSVNIKYLDPAGDNPEYLVTAESFTGDSRGNPKAPLERPTVTTFTDGDFTIDRPVWRGHGLDYGLQYDAVYNDPDMVIRAYNFMIPPPPTGYENFQIILTLNSGPSFLPTWTIDSDGTARQMFEVRRDEAGYIFCGLDVKTIRRDYVDYLDRNAFVLDEGFMPTWSYSQNDILAILPAGAPTCYVKTYDPNPDYLPDPANPDSLIAGFGHRNSQLLLRSDDQITGLKSHPYDEIIAVTTSNSSSGAVYTISTDGTDLTEIVSGADAIGARDPSWARNGIQLIYCSEDSVHLVNFVDGGYNVEQIIGPDSFLTDFHTPLFSYDAGFIMFSARRKVPIGGDDSLQMYMAAKNGRVISYRTASDGYPAPLLEGWDNADLYDFDLSPTGERMVFVANASSAPMYEDDILIINAEPSPNSRMFVLTNLRNVTDYGSTPHFSEVVPINEFWPGIEQSARWPRINPSNDGLVWVGFASEMDVRAGYALQGRLVRQPFDQEVVEGPPPTPTPYPTPTSTPGVTPPVPDNAKVVKSGEVRFDSNNAGWMFNSGGFSDVTQGYEQVAQIVAEVDPGIAAFYASADAQQDGTRIRVADLRFTALRAGTVNFSMIASGIRVTRTFNDLNLSLPTVLNADTATTASEARVYVEPASKTVVPGEVVSVRVRLDTNGQPVFGVEGYVQFDTALVRLSTGEVYRSIFDQTPSLGALTMVCDDSNSTFGFWQSPSAGLQVMPNALYLLRTYLSATSGTPDGEAPTVRIRINSRNLESSFGTVTNPLGDDSLSPMPDEIKPIDLLFRPPAALFSVPAYDRNYIMSFDLLNFLPGEIDPNSGLRLHRMDIYRLDDNAKHHALFGFNQPFTGADISFHAAGLSGVEGPMTISIRKCCELADTEVACVTGSAIGGVILDTTELVQGDYTILVTTDHQEDVVLSWDAEARVDPPTGDNCPAGEEYRWASGDAATACENKVPLSGNGRDPANSSLYLPVIASTFYDGTGYFELSSCDPSSNETVVKSMDPIYTADMTDPAARAEWVTGPETSPFSKPLFASTDRSLTLSATKNDQLFGYWDAEDIPLSAGDLATSPTSPVVIYKATYRVAVRADDLGPGETFDPKTIPDIRMRLATNDQQRSVEGLLIGFDQGVIAPEPGDPKDVELYLVLEKVPATVSGLIAAFDVLAFYPQSSFPDRAVTKVPIELELVRIERVNIPNYPPPYAE